MTRPTTFAYKVETYAIVPEPADGDPCRGCAFDAHPLDPEAYRLLPDCRGVIFVKEGAGEQGL